MFANAQYTAWRNKTPPAFSDQHQFDVKIPVQNNWERSKRRMLFIIEHVDTEDLKSSKLLKDGPSHHWVKSAMDLGMAHAKHLNPKTPSVAAINFQFFKTYDLDETSQSQAREVAAARVRAWIDRIKPTDVVVFGDDAAVALMGSFEKDERTLLLRRGRPYKRDGVYWTSTISPSRAYQGKAAEMDDDSDDHENLIDHANLLGFVGQCVGNALVRDLVYRIECTPKIKYVDSMKKFMWLYKRLMEADRFALDTETTGLGRIVNQVLTLQFSLDATATYIVPFDHMDARWTQGEKLKITKGIRNVLSRKFDPLSKRYDQYIIGQNLKFDLTIVRQRFSINHVQWRVWDLMAGEYGHDENRKALTKCSTALSGRLSPYTLEWMAAWYGCDFYAINAFSKDDRVTITTRSLKDPGVLDYCAQDSAICWSIHDAQLARAANRTVNKVNYLKPYGKFIVAQMSNLVQIESVMEHRGDQLDMPWLLKLKDVNGPLTTVRRELEGEFKGFKHVQRTNAWLAKKAHLPETTIFGQAPWVFSVTRPEHKQRLFINEMQLEPLSYGKSGAPRIDKFFQDAYKDMPEINVFTQLSQLGSLKGTYVNGFYDKLKEDADMRVDFRIRPGFGFTGTVTGRSNSYNPNLQNIPARGKFAKLIKRMFVAPRGCLTVKLDYSAHEVRVWGIVAEDKDLCELFVNGRWLRKMYRRTGNPAYKILMDTDGDIHKINSQTFFGVKTSEVTAEQRNSVKSIVFGAIYGRGAKAISVQAKSTVDIIKTVLEKFFKRFAKASGWLAFAKKHAVDHGYMYSPIMRLRNMFTQMYGRDNLVAATERRGCNAPIQGFAADIGHTAALLYQYHIEKVVREFGLDKDKVLRCGVNSFVHDAIKTDAPYEYLLVCMQVLSWCATTGVMGYYKTHWGIKFPVEIEVEFELAAHDETHWKWDWHEGAGETLDKGKAVGGGLAYCISKALADHKDVYPDVDIKKIEKTIWAVRNNKELTEYLDANYPILEDWPDAKHIDTSSTSFKQGLGKTVRELKAKLETGKKV